MALMQQDSEAGREARAAMAKLAGTTPDVFDDQLSTTYLYADPAAAVEATRSPALVETMTRVRDFSFAQGLSGQGPCLRQRGKGPARAGPKNFSLVHNNFFVSFFNKKLKK